MTDKKPARGTSRLAALTRQMAADGTLPEMFAPASRAEARKRINEQKKSIRTQIRNVHKALVDTAERFGDSPELQAERADLELLIETFDALVELLDDSDK